jgi:hypothetical protein
VTRFIRYGLFAAGLTVLVALAWRIGARTILDMLRRSGWAFAWVTALYALHVVLRALSLWRTFGPGGPGFRSTLRVRLAGEAIEMLTFTGPFLAEPSKGWLLTQQGVGAADAFGAIALEYLLYTAVAFWMSGAAISVFLARTTFGRGFERPALAILTAVAIFSGLFVAAAVRRRGFIAPAVKRAGHALRRREWAERTSSRVETVERVLVNFMHDRPARLFEVLTLELAGHVLLALEIWIVFSALGAPMSLVDALVMEGAIKLIAGVFFFIPGQLGAAESVYVVLADALRAAPAAGLTLALIRRLRAMLVAAIGLAAIAASTKSRL